LKLIPVVLLSASLACAADYTLPLTPSATKIEWTLTDPLHTVHGTFKLKRGSIKFDPDSGKASGEVVVDVASGDSGNGARDSRMHANVLESTKYPDAVFTPDRIDGKLSLAGASQVKVHGVFRIHGADHEMIMNADAKAAGDKLDVHLTFDIPYVAWGMKDPSNFLLKVGKTVQMSIDTTAPLAH
jgi:polyisoprenoid-binding protein YceI